MSWFDILKSAGYSRLYSKIEDHMFDLGSGVIVFSDKEIAAPGGKTKKLTTITRDNVNNIYIPSNEIPFSISQVGRKLYEDFASFLERQGIRATAYLGSESRNAPMTRIPQITFDVRGASKIPDAPDLS